LAAQIEQTGFDRLWFVDVQLPMKDSFAAMTLAATATSRLELGPGVANPRTRHLSVLANAMNAIQELSQGRALLGVGSGHTAVYGVGLRPATIAEMERAVVTLKRLGDGDEVDTDGKPYRLLTAGAARRPPVYVAATQARMLNLAGRLAEGVILMGAADVDLTSWQLERISEGLGEGNRQRSEIDIELWTAVSVGSPAAALRDVKAWAAAEARVLSDWKGELPGGLGRFREEFVRAKHEYDLSEHLSVHGQNVDLISDELASRLAVAGEPAECARRLTELAALGLDGVTITLLSGGREQRLVRMGTELLPALHAYRTPRGSVPPSPASQAGEVPRRS
jgi:5,10-methylenetetrahydromethanopterin reductase